MKTIVEAGHYYQVNGPSALSVKGWEVGKEFVANQADAELALFVDDYHQEQTFIEPGDTFFDREVAAQTAQTFYDEADHVFSESVFAEMAPQKIGELLEDGLVKLKKGVLSVGGVHLGYLPDSEISTFSPACVFLDYMLLIEKTKLGENQVTILPETYSKQQAQLSTVISKLVVPKLAVYKSLFYSLDPDEGVTQEEIYI
jgi:hypothetical protein